MPIDWREFLAHLPPAADRSFFQAVAGQGAGTAAAPKGQTATLVSQLRAIPASQRRQALVGQLADRARQVLGVDASVPLDTRVPLKESGLDSLMAVELRNAVARSAGRSLPATLLFDYPTLDALADHLMQLLTLDAGDEHRAMATEHSDLEHPERSAIAGLSDDEAEALLMKEMETGFSQRTHAGPIYER
jgi:acyl carrier protein